jgi:hypothetical protein
MNRNMRHYIRAMLAICLMMALPSLTACNGPSAPSLTAGPLDKTWLAPAKIQINRVTPDQEIRQTLQVHNGSRKEARYSVYYRTPDYTESGYSAAPLEAVKWLSITDNAPVLKPQETGEIIVTLTIPLKAATPDRWEFWIGVKEMIDNTVAAELCSRWLMGTR